MSGKSLYGQLRVGAEGALTDADARPAAGRSLRLPPPLPRAAAAAKTAGL
jgi:hypothetical protein